MIDLHSHVLPQVDDGANSWEETESILSGLASMGWSHIVATPHWAVGMPEVPDEVVSRFKEVASRSGLKASMARECRIHPDMLRHIEKNPQLRIDGGQVVLVELPWGPVPTYVLSVLLGLREAGYTPVLAHPERHGSLWEHETLLDQIIKLGVHLQVNLDSFGGLFGTRVRGQAIELLEQGRITVVASDIHAAEDVKGTVSESLALLTHVAGERLTSILTVDNPQALLDNRPPLDLSGFSHQIELDTSQIQERDRPDSLWRKILQSSKGMLEGFGR